MNYLEFNAIKKIINNLLEHIDFLGSQLLQCNGTLSNEEFEEISNKFFEDFKNKNDDDLRIMTYYLFELFKNELSLDMIMSCLKCEVSKAEQLREHLHNCLENQ